MADTTDLRDECARLMGYVKTWPGNQSDAQWEDPIRSPHKCQPHPVPDPLDAAIAIIESDGWTWERSAVGRESGDIEWFIDLYEPSGVWHSPAIKETGDRKRDFFSAALAKLRAQNGGQHGQV